MKFFRNFVEREYPRKIWDQLAFEPTTFQTHDLLFSKWMLLPLSYWNPDDRGAEVGVSWVRIPAGPRFFWDIQHLHIASVIDIIEITFIMMMMYDYIINFNNS